MTTAHCSTPERSQPARDPADGDHPGSNPGAAARHSAASTHTSAVPVAGSTASLTGVYRVYIARRALRLRQKPMPFRTVCCASSPYSTAHVPPLRETAVGPERSLRTLDQRHQTLRLLTLRLRGGRPSRINNALPDTPEVPGGYGRRSWGAQRAGAASWKSVTLDRHVRA